MKPLRSPFNFLVASFSLLVSSGIAPLFQRLFNSVSPFGSSGLIENLGNAMRDLGSFMNTTVTPMLRMAQESDKLVPIMYSLLGALGSYAIVVNSARLATVLFTAANKALGVAMLKNPLMWIVLLLGAVVGAVYHAYQNFEWFREGLQNFFERVKGWFSDLGVFDFFLGIFQQIKDFWASDGQQIIHAIQNFGQVLLNIANFVMPVLKFVVEFVWTAIQGIIQGAVRVIMGIIRVFTGLFTGDFSKMWEGVKDIFFGAVQFVWNLISITLVGRVVSIIRSLVMLLPRLFRNLWKWAQDIFFRGVEWVIRTMLRFVTGIRTQAGKARTAITNMATRMWDAVRTRFDNIVQGARELPGKIGRGIRAMAGRALSGIKSLGRSMGRGIANVINGVTGGVNWVLGKIGVSLTIPEWKPDFYAKGTPRGGHGGGPAVVGDGGGSELIATPNGRMFLSPAKDTLVNLPKGTQVMDHRKTASLLNNSYPAYAQGTENQSFFGRIGSGLKNAAGWVGDRMGDVFSLVSGGATAVVNKIIDTAGIVLPSVSNFASGMTLVPLQLLRTT
ncbi:phage tail length tape-measure protein [Geomicrobium sp. JCM 19037]|nr:phage tail length tape-measure protein [Geomicrobium sp. JCM 19037]